MSRRKGRRAESRAEALLVAHGHVVYDMTSGKETCDLLADDLKLGVQWAVEVKDRLLWDFTAFYRQAQAQRKGRARWMLLLHIPRTASWLVLRQGLRPVVWHERPE